MMARDPRERSVDRDKLRGMKQPRKEKTQREKLIELILKN